MPILLDGEVVMSLKSWFEYQWDQGVWVQFLLVLVVGAVLVTIGIVLICHFSNARSERVCLGLAADAGTQARWDSELGCRFRVGDRFVPREQVFFRADGKIYVESPAGR